MKKVGIIGGLGPMAMVYFLQLITEMTDAATDQEHIELLVHSKPQTPDRTGYIIGKSKENPLPVLTETGVELRSCGADFIAIPCITAHYFQQELEKQIGCPILHAIEETAAYLEKEGIKKVGLMATDGTIESRLFQKTMEQYGIECVVPEKENQAHVMHLIYDNVKAGKKPEMERFYCVSEALFAQGAQVVLLGCTELSLIKRDHALAAGFLDVLEVLARQVVVEAGANVKSEYTRLITGQTGNTELECGRKVE